MLLYCSSTHKDLILSLHCQIFIIIAGVIINYYFIFNFFVVVVTSLSNIVGRAGAAVIQVIFYVHRYAYESRFVTSLRHWTVAALFKFVH